MIIIYKKSYSRKYLWTTTSVLPILSAFFIKVISKTTFPSDWITKGQGSKLNECKTKIWMSETLNLCLHFTVFR